MGPGSIVADRFEIEALAGSGGMGAIFRARDRTTGLTVALKLLHQGGSEDGRTRFARESRVLADLAHPGIVRYVAHGAASATDLFLAMEWLEGEDLSVRLLRAGLTCTESVGLVRRVAEALGIAHARGVLHRDIKPSNLFLPQGDVGRVKVLDFGIAQVSSSLRSVTRTGATLGTPGYMSPEQARGDPTMDARGDVFSLGCVLYECLTGQPPFIGDHPMAVLAKILLEDAPRVGERAPGVPLALEDLVARMLSKDPAGRPRDGAGVASELCGLGEIGETQRAPVSVRSAALTMSEHRIVCAVLIRSLQPRAAMLEASSGPVSMTRTLDLGDEGALVAALGAAAGAFGAKLHALADGSAIATLVGLGAVTDQVARAARCALALRALAPSAPMALATGRGLLSACSPVGEVIERGVLLLAGRAARSSAAPDVAGPAARSSERLPIRIDQTTAGLLDARFEVGGDERGLDLRGERAGEGGERTLLGISTPCVGRERELGTLEAILAECISEPIARGVVVVAGPGVGKSRLRRELLRRVSAREPPVAIWSARGDPSSAGSPFGMLGQILRGLADVSDGEPLAVRQQKLRARIARHVASEQVPRITLFLAELVNAPFPDDASRQLQDARQDPLLMGDQMRAAWEELVAAECGAQPVLIVFEDLHWGDLPTVKYVDHALRQLQDRPLMVLALARPEVERLFPRLWGERGVEKIHLGDLTRKASERLVREVLGPSASAATVALVVERAAGNALFLEELIRAVAEGKGDQLPDTVLAMVQGRLEALETDARQVLRAASVFGQVFWRSGVTALLGRRHHTTQVKDWLAELCDREVIVARRQARFPGETEYTFHHALTREAAYAMLTDGDRALGHRLAATWLERAGETAAVVLAEHFERGGEPARSVAWYRIAAEQALEGDDLEAAIGRAGRAVLCGAEGEVLGALRLLQAEAHAWRGDFREAQDDAMAALALLPRGEPAWFSAVSALAQALCRSALDDRTLSVVEELTLARVTTSTQRAYAAAAAHCVITLLRGGRQDLADRLMARLLALAPVVTGTDAAALAWILHAQSWRAMYAGDPAECARLDAQVVECFLEAGDARQACLQRASVGYDLMMLGADAEADVAFSAAEVEARRMGLHQVTAMTVHNRGMVLARGGQLEAARALEEEAVALLVGHGNRMLESAARRYLAMVLQLEGDLEGAARELLIALECAAEALPLRTPALAQLAEVHLEAGRVDESLACAEEAHRLLEEVGAAEEGEALTRLVYARALHRSGRTAEATRIILLARDALLAQAARITEPRWRASFLAAIPEHARTLELADAWAVV